MKTMGKNMLKTQNYYRWTRSLFAKIFFWAGYITNISMNYKKPHVQTGLRVVTFQIFFREYL
jgi:hypothetical protein